MNLISYAQERLVKLRDQLHVPNVFNHELGSYMLDPNHTNEELPGLWFSQGEILALITIQKLLEQLQPGLFGNKLRSKVQMGFLEAAARYV